jgi:transketolase
MRVEFTHAITQVLARDDRSLLVSGDLGFSAFEGIAAAFGKRFLNAGVAEQNMVGVAAGLALAGYRPWVYSIAPFVTYRCLEQIRNDVCLHHLPVRLVGNGGGYTYGIMGSTHHALEDLGVLKPLPNLTLLFPCAGDQVGAAVEFIDRLGAPSYLRLGISPFATALRPLWENPVTLTRQYARGSAVTVLGVGQGLQVALAALDRHGLREVGADVFGLAQFPFNWGADAAVVQSVQKTGCVLVVEEHYPSGGMGESLKATLPPVPSFQVMAPAYAKGQLYGSARFHLEQCGVTPERLARRAAEMVQAKAKAGRAA